MDATLELQQRSQQRREALEKDNSFRNGRSSAARQTSAVIDQLEDQAVQQGMMDAGRAAASKKVKDEIKGKAVKFVRNKVITFVLANPVVIAVIVGLLLFAIIIGMVYKQVHDSTGVSIQQFCSGLGNTCAKTILEQGAEALKSNAN